MFLSIAEVQNRWESWLRPTFYMMVVGLKRPAQIPISLIFCVAPLLTPL